VKPLEVLSRERSILRNTIEALTFLVVLLSFCPAMSMADEQNIARDLANPFSSLWNIVNQLNFNQLRGCQASGRYSASGTDYQADIYACDSISICQEGVKGIRASQSIVPRRSVPNRFQ
jgi:hypothetical protein